MDENQIYRDALGRFRRENDVPKTPSPARDFETQEERA
jgi:hypothetical protein